jgi:cytochrome c-type biogenesis protein CcmH/NrfF
MKTCFLTTAFLFCSSVSFAQLIDVKPPLDYLSLAVWIFPAALGIVAALIVFVLIRRWRRLSGKKTKEILPPWKRKA